MPRLVNAGASGRGLRFAVSNCDVAFLMSGSDSGFIDSAKQAKSIAKELGKPDFKVYGLMTLIPGETDEQAQKLMDHLEAGVDTAGLADLAQGYDQNTKGRHAGISGSGPVLLIARLSPVIAAPKELTRSHFAADEAARRSGARGVHSGECGAVSGEELGLHCGVGAAIATSRTAGKAAVRGIRLDACPVAADKLIDDLP